MADNGKRLALEVDGVIVPLSVPEVSALRYALRRALHDARQRTRALERVCEVVELREEKDAPRTEISDGKLRAL